MKQQEFFPSKDEFEVTIMEKPKHKDAELAHQLSGYNYRMKFNSDKFVQGGIRCF